MNREISSAGGANPTLCCLPGSSWTFVCGSKPTGAAACAAARSNEGSWLFHSHVLAGMSCQKNGAGPCSGVWSRRGLLGPVPRSGCVTGGQDLRAFVFPATWHGRCHLCLSNVLLTGIHLNTFQWWNSRAGQVFGVSSCC